MAEELKWHEAMEAIHTSSLESVLSSEGYEYRVVGGQLQFRQPSAATWRNNANSLAMLMALTWRRVPKAPSLGELAGAWRREGWDGCAVELEAALREGDYVSLKGVTSDELYNVVYRVGSGGTSGCAELLAYLRSRGAK